MIVAFSVGLVLGIMVGMWLAVKVMARAGVDLRGILAVLQR